MNLFQHLTTHPLRYVGDCSLIALTPHQQLYVEESYEDRDEEIYLAQHILTPDGKIVESIDEAYGKRAFHPLPLPENSLLPQSVTHSSALRYVGGRYRGLREAERLTEWVQPLTLPEKMALIDYLKKYSNTDFPVASAMMLMGIAESVPLAEVLMEASGQLLVCRRVRIAVALPERRMDDDDEPFDYDTVAVYLLHAYDAATMSAPPLHETWGGLGHHDLHRPMSLLLDADCLYVGDGGIGEQVSRVLVYQLNARA